MWRSDDECSIMAKEEREERKSGPHTQQSAACWFFFTSHLNFWRFMGLVCRQMDKNDQRSNDRTKQEQTIHNCQMPILNSQRQSNKYFEMPISNTERLPNERSELEVQCTHMIKHISWLKFVRLNIESTYRTTHVFKIGRRELKRLLE
jgi:hypothetical protein